MSTEFCENRNNEDDFFSIKIGGDTSFNRKTISPDDNLSHSVVPSISRACSNSEGDQRFSEIGIFYRRAVPLLPGASSSKVSPNRTEWGLRPTDTFHLGTRLTFASFINTPAPPPPPPLEMLRLVGGDRLRRRMLLTRWRTLLQLLLRVGWRFTSSNVSCAL